MWDILKERPDVFEDIKAEVHKTARASAGGQMKAKYAKEAADGKEEAEAETMLKTNASSFGGKVLEVTDETTVIPVVLQAEGVRNGALQRYDDFSNDYRWYEGVPIIPEHHQGDPPASHRTNKLGQIRNVKLNAEKRRVEAEAVLFNSKFIQDDLARIQAGEAFPGSIGFYADDEPLGMSQTWSDGQSYNRIEKNFFGDHFSIVASPACPLGKCGFNVNAKEPDIMVEEVKVEVPKTNAEVKPDEVPVINVAAPTVNVDLSTVLTEMKSMRDEFATLKTNIAEKDTKIATLEAAETIRQNAAREQADAAAKAGFAAILNANAKMDVEKLYPEYAKAPALWIVTNTKLLDVKGIEAGVIVPAGQAFVPHVNADDEEAGYAAVGVPSVEDLGKLVRGG